MKSILILENVTETRQWLARLLASAFPAPLTTEASCLADVPDSLIKENDFDLALIDLRLPDGCGLDTLRRIRVLSPATLCVVVTSFGEDSDVVAALAAGADGYLLKDQPEDQIRVQLADLSHGLAAISPGIARRIAKHFSLTGPTAQEDSLTRRESEVLALISRGLRNAEVAESLEISSNTVASHIKAIYHKLSISSRAEASWHATRLGL